MPPPADVQFWSGLWKVIVADIILAGDNAIVIALAVRSLPERQQFFGRMFGALGAVLLRVVFVWAVTWLLAIPFLRLIGGLLLVWIAWKLVRHPPGEEEAGEIRAGATLWQAIWIIVFADVVMSFDNVIAISAASHGRIELVVVGVLLSIPLVIFGSGILSHLMKKLPLLIWLGAGLLGQVAGQMMIEDDRVRAALGPAWLAPLDRWLPMTMLVILTAIGWWLARRGVNARGT